MALHWFWHSLSTEWSVCLCSVNPTISFRMPVNYSHLEVKGENLPEVKQLTRSRAQVLTILTLKNLLFPLYPLQQLEILASRKRTFFCQAEGIKGLKSLVFYSTGSSASQLSRNSHQSCWKHIHNHPISRKRGMGGGKASHWNTRPPVHLITCTLTNALTVYLLPSVTSSVTRQP